LNIIITIRLGYSDDLDVDAWYLWA